MKKVLIYFVSILILIVIGVTVSFAYYSLRVSGNPSGISVSAGKLKIYYNTTQYINTTTASPILAANVSSEASKLFFNITNSTSSSLNFKAKASEFEIDSELVNSSFKWKIDQCSGVSDTACTTSVTSGTFELASGNTFYFTGNNSYPVSSNTTQYYVLRIWLEDNGGDQTYMMGKYMTGKLLLYY